MFKGHFTVHSFSRTLLVFRTVISSTPFLQSALSPQHATCSIDTLPRACLGAKVLPISLPHIVLLVVNHEYHTTIPLLRLRVFHYHTTQLLFPLTALNRTHQYYNDSANISTCHSPGQSQRHNSHNTHLPSLYHETKHSNTTISAPPNTHGSRYYSPTSPHGTCTAPRRKSTHSRATACPAQPVAKLAEITISAFKRPITHPRSPCVDPWF